MNKREFILGGCATLLAGGAVAGERPAQAPRDATTKRLRRLPELASGVGAEEWRAYLDHVFRVGATPRKLILQAVRDDPSSASLRQFTLVFADRNGAQPLAAGTHWLVHPSRQRLVLYLEPAGRVRSLASYRAQFSLLA